jgi:hypothetical protein
VNTVTSSMAASAHSSCTMLMYDVTAAEVDSVIPVTTPRVYVIQPANLTDQATTIITSLDSISVKEWSDAQRADAAWAPWLDYFEQQRLPVDKTVETHNEQQYTLRDQAVCAEVSVLLAACEKSDLSKEMLPGEASLRSFQRMLANSE